MTVKGGLNQGFRGKDAVEVGGGGRVLRGQVQFGFHKPIDLLEVVGAVAEDDVEEFLDGDFAAVVGGDDAVEGGGVVALEKGGDAADDALAVVGDFPGELNRFEPLAARLHIVGGHLAGAVAEPGQFGEGEDVNDGVAQGFGPPGDFPLQLAGRELEGGAEGGVEDAVIFVGHPEGAAGEVNLGVEVEDGDEFAGVVADDDLAVDDGDRGGFDAVAVQESLGVRVGGDVVMFILNIVGREEFLKRPAAESTRVGIDMDVHLGGSGGFWRLLGFRIAETLGCGKGRMTDPKLKLRRPFFLKCLDALLRVGGSGEVLGEGLAFQGNALPQGQVFALLGDGLYPAQAGTAFAA